MTPARGYYSLIQYCPDPARAEAVNVGVLLFCPDQGFLDARIRRRNDRIRSAFPFHQFDPACLNAAKQAVVNRIRKHCDEFQTLEELQRYIRSRGNEILLTEPRLIKVKDPAATLIDLFNELVGPDSKQRRKESVIPELDQKLRAPGMAERVLFDREVEVPVMKKKLIVPYAYQNGCLNLVRPLVLQPSDRGLNSAARAAFESEKIQRHTPMRVKAVIDVRRGDKACEVAHRVTEMFEDSDIQAFARQSLDDLLRMIDQEAHAVSESD